MKVCLLAFPGEISASAYTTGAKSWQMEPYVLRARHYLKILNSIIVFNLVKVMHYFTSNGNAKVAKDDSMLVGISPTPWRPNWNAHISTFVRPCPLPTTTKVPARSFAEAFSVTESPAGGYSAIEQCFTSRTLNIVARFTFNFTVTTFYRTKALTLSGVVAVKRLLARAADATKNIARLSDFFPVSNHLAYRHIRRVA